MWIRLGNPRNYTHYSVLGFSLNMKVERNPKTRISASFDDLCSSWVNEGIRTSSFLTLFSCNKWIRLGNPIALYPGQVFGGKCGLVYTVYACTDDSGNFPLTSPNMDKFHMVVMRRNNQTRYTACSVAAVFTRRLFLSSLSY